MLTGRTHGLGLGGALLHVTLPSLQCHMLMTPAPCLRAAQSTHLSPGLLSTQSPRLSRMRLLVGPSLSLTAAHTSSPPHFGYESHRGKRALVLPPTLRVHPPTALVRLLAVWDLSGPEAYSPGRFSGRQLWHPVVLCRLYERSEARGEVSGGTSE